MYQIRIWKASRVKYLIKIVNWNVKETYFNLHLNYMAAFDWIKLFLTFKKILTLHSVEVPSSLNSSPIFVIVFLGETNKSSLSQMFSKIGILKNLANFIGKHQCWSIFLMKFQAWRPATLIKETPTRVFSCEICEIFKNTAFYRTPPVAASAQTQEISVVDCVAKWFSGHLVQVYLRYPISC